MVRGTVEWGGTALKLSGRNIVVTGGTSGIGRALVDELADRGNALLTCGRDRDRLAELSADRPDVTVVDADLATPEGVTRLVSTIRERFERLDVLVNNAGVSTGFDLDDLAGTAERSAHLIATNVTALVRLSIECIPLLHRSDDAAIVNVTSIVAHVPKGRAPVYSASKAAVRAFTVALRSALDGSSIAVVDVLPPLVESRMPGPVGMQRMDAARFAGIVVTAMGRDARDIRVGRNRWIALLSRVSPRLADRLIG